MADQNLNLAVVVDEDLIIPDDGLTLLADDVLLDLVRGGNASAYGVLFERYRHPAHRLAAYFSNSVDAKDIVAETFADVLHQLRRGKGPHTSFRSYLFTSVRREAGKRARLHKRVRVTSDQATIDKPVPFGGGGCDTFERELVRAAFASLPTRWRTVLWQLDVDGRKPHELALHLGLKPNAVSALAYRAREGLRKAYLEQHVLTNGTSLAAECTEVRSRMVTFVRGSATTRDVILIDPHLETCVQCMEVYLELEEVNTHLGSVSSMIALGFAAPMSGVVGSLIAKASVAAKSVVATVGSAAAVVITSVSISQIPMPPPAEATTVQAPQHPPIQHEPDRTQGPAADGNPGPRTQSDSTELGGAEELIPGQTMPLLPAPSQPSSVDLPGAGVNVSSDGGGADASVDASGAGVSASVDVPAGVSASVDLPGAEVDVSVDPGGVNVSTFADVGGTKLSASADLDEPSKTAVTINEIEIEAADVKTLSDTARELVEKE